jgi:hypothetical protein
MTTTDTITDIAKLEAAEDALDRAIYELDCIAEDLAISPALQRWPGRKDLVAVIADLNDALDCLQIGLGRPYVWLLARREV